MEIASYRLAPVFLLALLSAMSATAEEALDRQGRSWHGTLAHDAGKWLFRGNGAHLPLERIARIRFASAAAPVPPTLLTMRLLLGQHQHLTGTLLSLDEKDVRFLTSWGQPVVVPRSQVRGLEQPDNLLLLQREIFESRPRTQHAGAEPVLSTEYAFSGKASLLLNRPESDYALSLPSPLKDGRLSACVYDPGTGQGLKWHVDLLWSGGRAQSAVVISTDGYAAPNAAVTYGSLSATNGWHWIQVDVAAGRWRAYVDDYLLGEGQQAELHECIGVQIRCLAVNPGKPAAGARWFDDILLAKKVEPLARPTAAADQDLLWLAGGEELFGRVTAAGPEGVLLHGRFGKRSFAWSAVRGFYLATKGATVAADIPGTVAEVSFRPGPGVSADRLRVALQAWDGAELVARHPLLGELRLERRRLISLRFPDTH